MRAHLTLILRLTWLTTITMAEQRPTRKAVASSISTLVANTVSIQEAEKGRDTARRAFLLPHLSTKELRRPPRSAPSNDREASQDVCW